MTHDNIKLSVPEHPFAQYVRILGKGKKGSRSFTEEEAYAAMSMILNNEVEDLQLGAFLMLIRVKEETVDELSGFVKAVKAYMQVPEALSADLDWSSYAGKRRHLPWFIFSALLVADSGQRVFMHGASGHTHNRIYTESILKALKLPVCETWADCKDALDQDNFCYAPLQSVCAPLAKMIDMRSILGLRSPVHSLSRLINPLSAPAVLQGIFHPPYAPLHQQAGASLGYSSLCVLKGEGGEFERNPDNSATTYHSIAGDLSEDEWPALFARRHVKPDSLTLDKMISVWRGSDLTNEEVEYSEAAVISTAAIALKTIAPTQSQEDCLQKARNLWDDRDKARF
jgi:anthranilate phosphoribosyltransferase